ncbi:tyrosine--trna ligase precursor, mitochondrial (cyt-18) [Schizothecium vesticola]|uniref:Tyrosine--tRNA ligase n=1 Tax=Schizothecium vesticola TaxID=314040 RepID=A0AA40EW77_9PEZI|nr:tyrosine--trna ligase precursor, mitochondrial (cyt-18) [Schizothecium vesticola]
MKKKLKSPKYTAKVEDAENEWDHQAEKIKKGEAKNLWDVLEERGFVKDVAGKRETIRELMRTRRIGAYVGIDPTANSLHLGHLVPLMPLFWMYMHGYKAFSLVGGSTARIGDPTDRLQSRAPLAKSDYVANMAKIHFQLKTLWTHIEEQARLRGFEKKWASRKGIVNNNAWWNSQPMYEIMKRVGMYLRLGPMLSRDTVKKKMEAGDGMSVAELCYPIMQGWDWFELARQLGVQMQIGGSDQFGNILTGIEVFKAARNSDKDPASRLPRDNELDDPVGFTVPLLTDSKGAKFGKTAGNAVWLDPFLTSIYDMYGYLVRRPDADVERLLKLLTFLPLEDIQQLMADHTNDPSRRVAQHRLALEVTSLIHGTRNAADAAEQHRAMYRKPAPDGEEQYQAVVGHPTTPTNRPRMDMMLPRSLIMSTSIGRILQAAGLADSASAGHRLAATQGAYIGGAPGQKRAMDPSALAFTPVKVWAAQDTQKYLIDDEYLILRKGKHNLRIIKVVSDEEYAASGLTYPGQPYTGVVRKTNMRLKEIKHDSTLAEKIAKELEAESNAQKEAASGRTLIFPEDKGRQRREIEERLREQLKKSEEREEGEEGPESDEKTK